MVFELYFVNVSELCSLRLAMLTLMSLVKVWGKFSVRVVISTRPNAAMEDKAVSFVRSSALPETAYLHLETHTIPPIPNHFCSFPWSSL